MAISRLIPFVVCWGFAGVACAMPLTLLVNAPRSAAHEPPPAQNCLIDTKPCANLSKVPASPCLVSTKTCLWNGKFVAIAPTPPRR